MSQKYIPPHMRNANAIQQNIEVQVIERTSWSSQELNEHFATPAQGTLGSPSSGECLNRILIYSNQHPEYPPTIFVKTSLNLIFSDNGHGSIREDILDPSVQIPLFAQKPGRGRGQAGPFSFEGWVTIKDARRLKKDSTELIDMLTRKWQRSRPSRPRGEQTTTYTSDQNTITAKLEDTRPRSEGAWKTSLSVDWAVITLENVEGRSDNPMDDPTTPVEEDKHIKNDDVEHEIDTEDNTTPTRTRSSVTLKAFMLDHYPMQSPSVHSELIDSVSSLAPSLILSPLDIESSEEDINQIHRTNSQQNSMIDSLTHEFGAVSIVNSETDAALDTDDEDRWSELSSGAPEKAWTVVDTKDSELHV